MSRLYNTFNFTGNINIPKSADKFHKVNNFDGGWEKHTLNFAVKESNTNSAFVELVGGFFASKQNVVKTMGKGTESNNGAKLEIPWTDRLKEETVDMVADFRKIIVDFTTDKDLKDKLNQLRYEIRSLEYKDQLTDAEQEKLSKLRKEHRELAVDRYEFIHPYDAVIFLANKLEEYKVHKFQITGNVAFSYWKGKFYRSFELQTIEIVENDTPSKLRATMDVFFTKGALDEKDLKKEKKIYVDGYLLSRDNQAKKDQFFPQQLLINASKLDFENEEHMKRLEYLKRQFNVEKKNDVYHLQWEVSVFRGADQVEFSEKDLTPAQKEQIEFGYAKLDDFKPKGGMLGETVYETRLIKPILLKVNEHNDFTNGAVKTDYKVEDLDYVPTVPEEKKEKPAEKKEEPKQVNKPPVNLDDLFG